MLTVAATALHLCACTADDEQGADCLTAAGQDATQESLAAELDGQWRGAISISHTQELLPNRVCEGSIELAVDVMSQSGGGIVDCSFPAEEDEAPPFEGSEWDAELSVVHAGYECTGVADERLAIHMLWTLPSGEQFIWDEFLTIGDTNTLVLSEHALVRWWSDTGGDSEIEFVAFELSPTSGQ